MKSHHSHLAAYLTMGCWHLWNILWLMPSVEIVRPLFSLLSACLEETRPLPLWTEGHIPTIPMTANTLQLPGLFLGQLKQGGRGRKRESQTAEKRWNQKCCIPEAFISPNEMETVKGKHCFAFLKIVFPVEWVEKKISFPFPAILRDVLAKSAGLVGETRCIYFPHTLVIYEVAINAEFMEVKSGHEIKRILFKYPSLLILSNSSQRRWARMHTRFTAF